MTIDLWMLVASALWCLTIPAISVSGLLAQPGGSAWGFGNRAEPFPVPAWVGRARRAHANMIENLAPFACLVVAAYLGGKANGTTALGAEIFFFARVAYTFIYVAGIPVLRTLVFGVATAGMVMIATQILH